MIVRWIFLSFSVLWPDCLCEHIAGETNEYGRQVKAKNWIDTSGEEVWVFLGIVMEMAWVYTECLG